MGLHRRAGACSRRNERLESKKAAGVNPRPTKGYRLCPMCLCNTKAKLAIKQKDKLEFDEEVKNENTDN